MACSAQRDAPPDGSSPAPSRGAGQSPSVRVLDLESGNSLQYAIVPLPDAPLVVFVHGTPGGWSSFSKVLSLPELQARTELLSVDRPGWGGSALPRAPGARRPTVWASLERQADALRQLLEEQADERPVILVGHSLGGPVVARAAMDHPKLVQGLVLVAASIDPELEKTTWYQAIGRWRVVRWMLPRMLVAADLEIQPLREELETMLPQWGTIRIPVEILHGEKDRLVPIENADFAMRELNNARETRLPRRGHLLHVNEPREIAAAVMRVLDRLVPP